MSNNNTRPKFVAYCRVSTVEQGHAGLGVDAQQHAIRGYAASVGGELVREFVEVASGGDDERPVLAAALKFARRAGATLLVSKLDRLSREVSLIAGLLRSGTAFRVCECAGAGVLELQIRAVIAQEERRMIGERTKAALEAAKRRGVRLGSARPGHWDGREDQREAGRRRGVERAAEVRRELRQDVYAAAMPIAEREQAAGASLRAIAGTLNAAGITTPRGCIWRPAQVQRLLSSAEVASAR